MTAHDPFDLPSEPHLEAEVTFLPTADSGRHLAAIDRFRAIHRFGPISSLDDAIHLYPEVDSVAPGETATAHVILVTPERQRGRLRPGLSFVVQEGAQPVATGVVTRVLDEALLASS